MTSSTRIWCAWEEDHFLKDDFNEHLVHIGADQSLPKHNAEGFEVDDDGYPKTQLEVTWVVL